MEYGELKMEKGRLQQMKLIHSRGTMLQLHALAPTIPLLNSQLSILHSQLSILNYQLSRGFAWQ